MQEMQLCGAMLGLKNIGISYTLKRGCFMARTYYITKNGRIRRKQNTIYFENEKLKIKKPIPVEDIDSIYLFGEVDFNTKLINFLSQKNIPVFFFNYYGFYTGTFYPRETNVSGHLLVKQVEASNNQEERLIIASGIIEAATFNLLRNLRYYQDKNEDIEELIKRMKEENKRIPKAKSIEELMGIEGRMRQSYYKAFNYILDIDFDFKKRVRRPPDNIVNTLISFGNSMLYTATLGEIYKTQLNPTISFLHSAGTGRFSLSLDISEVFKPLIVDKIIFKLINKNMISNKDFEKDLDFCYLKEKGRKLFISEFDEKLKTTIKHRRLKRKVSYRTLIRLEAYKIQKHLLGMEKYKGLKAWW